MYSILLVDDEESVRTSIKDFTPWQSYGFEEPRVASNGLEALELIDEKMPDVIIVDIKMPYMNGIEFIKNVRENYSSTAQIVILSGFDEFTFAQEAVRLKVSEYVLKPITIDSMKSLLERIKTRIEEDKNRIKLLDNAPIYEKAFELYKERFFTSLITSKMKKHSEEDIRKRAELFGLPIQSKMFAIAAMESQENISFTSTLENISKECTLNSITSHMMFQYENQLIILFYSNMNHEFNSLFKRQIYRIISLLKESISHYFDYKYHVGIGNVVENLEDIPTSYEGALKALNHSLFEPEQYIIDVNDIQKVEHETSVVNTGELKSELVFALKFGSKEDCIKTVHSCFTTIFGQEDIQSVVLFILGAISEILHQYSYKLSDIVVGEDLFSQLAHIKSITSGENFCIDLALKANAKTTGKRENSRIEFVENAKKIILKRYAEPLFGLDTLCEEISVSPAYFSTTFKKETGVSFVQFLTNIRIEKAKELLKNSDDKTYVIAEKVGFSEPNYFSFTFKKNVGMSPSQYRAKERI